MLLVVESHRSHHIRLDFKDAPEDQKPSPKAKKTLRVHSKLSPPRKEKEEATTDVLFVTARNAKTLKTALEQAGYLDKKFRMAKAESGPSLENAGWHIAVPVTRECLATLEGDDEQPKWSSLIVAKGQQPVPFSTAVLGRK